MDQKVAAIEMDLNPDGSNVPQKRPSRAAAVFDSK
jgi:hypothetical protein